MRRADALRLIGGLVTASVVTGCGNQRCTSYPVPASSGNPLTPTRLGTQIYETDDIDRSLSLIAGCGGRIIRFELTGTTDFPDALCAAAARANMRVILLSQRVAQPVDVTSYAQNCAALQQRYARYNPVWEIWNEPNLEFFWGAPPNVDDYSRLAIATGAALRAAGARDVWSGGVSGIRVSWIAQLKSNGVFNVMNGCAVHSYNPACEAYSDYLELYRNLPAGVVIHTTETCLPSSLTVDQAGFLREMWYIHRIFGIDTMIWCEFRDGTAGNTGAYSLPYGLVDANYSRKASYFAAKSVTGTS